MIWVLALCGAMLFVSALLTLICVEKGPTSLDRMIAVDVITAVLLGALALLAAWTRRPDLVAVFVVVSVSGFLGSVAVARVARPVDPEVRRILTAEEARQLDLQAEDDDVPPAHEVDDIASVDEEEFVDDDEMRRDD